MNTPKTAFIIPVKKYEESKTRLQVILNLEERIKLSRYLVEDLLEKVNRISNSKTFLITNQDIKIAPEIHKNIVIVEEGQSYNLNNALKRADKYIEKEVYESTIVIPIDLPLLETSNLEKIISFSRKFDKGICIVPSYRYDGTNILLRKPHSVIETSYDNCSYYNHLKNAIDKKIEAKVFYFDSLRQDLDTIEDAKNLISQYKYFLTRRSSNNENDLKREKNRAINYMIDIFNKKKEYTIQADSNASNIK